VTGADVLEVLEALRGAGVEVWLDGGWGVDALAGRETRAHSDVDLALDRDRLAAAREALEAAGFEHASTAKPGLPARLVMIDLEGREVDLHPLVFDTEGNGWQQLSDSGRAWGCYPAEHLRATGTVAGQTVRCVSAEAPASLPARLRMERRRRARRPAAGRRVRAATPARVRDCRA
jgi:lincosamide nucleotidyltransferase A/C/D/E